MATNFTSDLKRTARKNILKSFFGSGVVGRAVMRTLGKKQEEEDPVSEALEEQNTVQDQINATIMRLESVVTNIADNVYNIAGVWSDHVVSMKEAKRIQEERLSKQQAELEEAQNESTKVLAPLPSATTVTKPEDTAQSGVVGGLMKSLTGTRNLLRGLMGKVGLIAAGLAVAGVASAALGNAATLANGAGNSGDESAPTSESHASTSSLESPSSLSGLSPANNDTEDTRRRIEQLKASTSPTQPQASLVSQPAAATTSTSGTTNVIAKDRPVVAQVNGQPYQFRNEQEYKEYKANPSQFLLQTNNGMYVAVKSAAASSAAAIGTSSFTPTSSTSAGGLSGTRGSSSSGGGSAAGLSPGSSSDTLPSRGEVSSLASSIPTTGKDISNMSTAVAASPTPSSQAATTVIENNSSSVEDDSEPSPLPSPIADRGSLDIGTTFRARY